MLGKVRI